MDKKNSNQGGMRLPGETQDPYLDKDLPGNEKRQPPGPETPGKKDEPVKKKDINNDDKEPVDERSDNL